MSAVQELPDLLSSSSSYTRLLLLPQLHPCPQSRPQKRFWDFWTYLVLRSWSASFLETNDSTCLWNPLLRNIPFPRVWAARNPWTKRARDGNQYLEVSRSSCPDCKRDGLFHAVTDHATKSHLGTIGCNLIKDWNDFQMMSEMHGNAWASFV